MASGSPDFIFANFPVGLIAMWHGVLSAIPAGWVLCDGNNGTPNLLGKFVQGVSTNTTDPGSTGGSVSKTTSLGGEVSGGINGAQAPATGQHTHAISDARPPYYELAFIMKT
jgi:hypothetical protein